MYIFKEKHTRKPAIIIHWRAIINALLMLKQNAVFVVFVVMFQAFLFYSMTIANGIYKTQQNQTLAIYAQVNTDNNSINKALKTIDGITKTTFYNGDEATNKIFGVKNTPVSDIIASNFSKIAIVTITPQNTTIEKIIKLIKTANPKLIVEFIHKPKPKKIWQWLPFSFVVAIWFLLCLTALYYFAHYKNNVVKAQIQKFAKSNHIALPFNYILMFILLFGLVLSSVAGNFINELQPFNNQLIINKTYLLPWLQSLGFINWRVYLLLFVGVCILIYFTVYVLITNKINNIKKNR